MNIDKYLNNTTSGQECQIYKVDNFTERGSNEIIYIGDYGLQELQEYKDSCLDLSDEEIVQLGIGSTKNSIMDEIVSYTDVTHEQIEKFGFVELIFTECDWCYTSTEILQFDFDCYFEI